jgi:hypothetical protein
VILHGRHNGAGLGGEAATAALDDMIDQQARIIAHNNDFRLMTLTIVLLLLLLMFMHRRARPEAAAGGD